MRYAGSALLIVVVGVSTGLAQPAGVPPAPADAKLDGYLANWEKTMGGLKSFYFDLALKRTDPAAAIFKGNREYTGSVLGMKPNLVRLRLEDKDKPRDYEAFTCTGEVVYAYNGLLKTITRYKVPNPKRNPAGKTGNLILDLIAGMTAKDLQERFELELRSEDKNYVYLDIKPRLAPDKQEFQQLRLALHGPKSTVAYLPAAIRLVKPSGEIEEWKLTNHRTNIPKLVPGEVFKYVAVDGYTLQDAPDPPPPARALPGRPTPPAGSGRP